MYGVIKGAGSSSADTCSRVSIIMSPTGSGRSIAPHVRTAEHMIDAAHVDMQLGRMIVAFQRALPCPHDREIIAAASCVFDVSRYGSCGAHTRM
jgi:hypothetical protein